MTRYFLVYWLPASPGGLVLKIGTFDFPIVSWTLPPAGGYFGKIKARIPLRSASERAEC
jgi:hypothetical protein